MTTTDPMSRTQPIRALDQQQRDQLDAAIIELASGAKRWASTPLSERAALLGAVHAAMTGAAQEWAETAAAIKGLDPSSQLVGEEWISGPYASLSGAGTLAQSIAALAAGRSPLASSRFGTAPGGRVIVPVLPTNGYEWLLLHGFSAEIWMAPGRSPEEVRASAGLGELTPTTSGGVGLVLGAGNITSIPPLDVLYEIVANNRSVLLKLNPVMAGMKSVFDKALAPLIKIGVLRIVQGAGDVGAYLTQHDGIAHVHITGSAATHDAIVWGTGADAASRKATGTPLLGKPITSELGGVSPIIVLPSAWTKRDLRYQAEHVVTQRLHNGGYNCIAGQVVVVSSNWPQKKAFLAALRRALAAAPQRPAWYPGSDGRMRAASAAYPTAERMGQDGCRLLIDVTAEDDASNVITTEYFSPVLGVVEVPGTGQAFLDAAVTLANDEFVGTLGANLIVEPKVIRQLGTGFLESIARLRYGTIAINAWTGLGFLTATASWGAFPGATIDNVQSGIGTVHNALLIDRPERTIVRGPFRPFPRSFAHGEFTLFPKPPWFVQARSAATTGRRLAGFAAKPSWLKMPAIFLAAFRA
ncbi:aldehyde dehydrogenase family protein [Cryobacterium sp. TMT1-2-2]|uniref:aldehyde dehydrogenase family protein n=1 Tax=Cryobacterium sp. TMT1-2-2 TaxID=1259233 RepID=UPI001F53E7BF|nr:aldehyde dehydrogenase family protein [Cryobacterium sp. TMT1-2-2]